MAGDSCFLETLSFFVQMLYKITVLSKRNTDTWIYIFKDLLHFRAGKILLVTYRNPPLYKFNPTQRKKSTQLLSLQIFKFRVIVPEVVSHICSFLCQHLLLNNTPFYTKQCIKFQRYSRTSRKGYWSSKWPHHTDRYLLVHHVLLEKYTSNSTMW